MVKTADGIPLLQMLNVDSNFPVELDESDANFKIVLNDIRFFPGHYNVSLILSDGGYHVYDRIEDALTFTIQDGGAIAKRSLPRHEGLIFLTPEWGRLL